MLAGYTQLSATAAPSTSRINTPSPWSKPQHDAVHRKGRTPETGLIQHLRSGYDVRLVIQLAEADADGTILPKDRVRLYRAAVEAAWPPGDERLDLLQAAAW